jgi:hypothetical protein
MRASNTLNIKKNTLFKMKLKTIFILLLLTSLITEPTIFAVPETYFPSWFKPDTTIEYKITGDSFPNGFIKYTVLEVMDYNHSYRIREVNPFGENITILFNHEEQQTFFFTNSQYESLLSNPYQVISGASIVGNETITVDAGTFSCTKYKIAPSNNVMEDSYVWIDENLHIIIKSESELGAFELSYINIEVDTQESESKEFEQLEPEESEQTETEQKESELKQEQSRIPGYPSITIVLGLSFVIIIIYIRTRS